MGRMGIKSSIQHRHPKTKAIVCTPGLILVHLPVLNPQDEVNNDSGEEGNGEDGRTESVIDTALSAPTDTLCAPMECHQGVNHRAHGNDGE